MKLGKKIIYNTFRCNSNYKKESLNDILKGTKSVLVSKNGFQQYISNYSKCTKKTTFKNPEITDYPLLKTESSFLVPVKKIINNNSEDNIKKIKKNPKQKIFLYNLLNQKSYSTFLEKYNKRFNEFLRNKTEPNNLRIIKKRDFEKRFRRYNSFFIDFFDKWNGYNEYNNLHQVKQNNIITEINSEINDSYNKKLNNNNFSYNNISFNKKERYSGLHYDENEIFNTNYDKFILDKINYTKNNKIQNFDINLESYFNDFNEKKINLKLESIKINFYPQSKNNNNNFFIYLPLSYVFLFYHKDIHFFQKVLMSILYFDEDFKSIKFIDNELYSLLKSINLNEKKEKEEEKNDENDFDYLSNLKLFKNSYHEKNTFLKGNYKQNIIDKKELYEKEIRKTYNKHNNHFTNKLFSKKSSEKIETPKNSNKNIKIKIMHSKRNFKSYSFNEENKNNIENKENIMNKNDLFYNEYYFIWETPKISYKIKVEMPKIFFSYEDIEYKIVTYCDKNLFLYLYKNNFINWDFYTLYYIFSLKNFRSIILQFLSFNKKYSLIENLKINKKQIKYFKDISMDNNYQNLYKLIEDNINKSKNIFLINKKIFNQINENNETFIFFYSDLNQKNYILNFFSYHIQIEYKRLNPNLKWEFFLNFKQMKYFNEISKYENLINFLPKIIKTDFEYGKLSLNISVFDNNFNAKILASEGNSLKKSKIDNEMNIEINKPYLIIENIFKDDKKLLRQEFNYLFLQTLNRIKIEKWPKKIVETLKNDLILEKEEEIKQINMFKSKYFKINGNNHDFQLKYKINRSSKQKLTYIGKNNNTNYEIILKSLKKLKTKEN